MAPVGLALAIALVAFVTAHLALVVGLARRARSPSGGRWWQPAAALVVMPLAPWWGYRAGMRKWALAWGAALLIYALGTLVAAAR
jgi:hypothetical protein